MTLTMPGMRLWFVGTARVARVLLPSHSLSLSLFFFSCHIGAYEGGPDGRLTLMNVSRLSKLNGKLGKAREGGGAMLKMKTVTKTEMNEREQAHTLRTTSPWALLTGDWAGDCVCVNGWRQRWRRQRRRGHCLDTFGTVSARNCATVEVFRGRFEVCDPTLQLSEVCGACVWCGVVFGVCGIESNLCAQTHWNIVQCAAA